MLVAERPILTEDKVSEFHSRFTLEPLEPDFGYTLGNSLRRILLSSIPGAAVTSIRIDGVARGFRTIGGAKEDVAEIILNIRQVVLSSENDEPVVMYLRKADPGTVAASDITPLAGVEIHNPEPTLTTLNEEDKLEIELTVECGRGYMSATQNRNLQAEVSRIPIDSIYSPVVKVIYRVEAARIEQYTDSDRLIIDVETKPAIIPRDAPTPAGKTLTELFGLMRELNGETESIEVEPSTIDVTLTADLALPTGSLNLQSRSYNMLRRREILTVGKLVTRSEADLLGIRNFGTESIEEIKEALAGLGVILKDSVMPNFGDSDSGLIQFNNEQSI